MGSIRSVTLVGEMGIGMIVSLIVVLVVGYVGQAAARWVEDSDEEFGVYGKFSAAVCCVGWS